MNTLQAKQIKIIDYLNTISVYPVRTYGDFYYYHAIYRNDSTPSLKVNINNNLWYDLGTGNGGNIIDLVCLIHNCNVTNGLNEISKQNIKSFSFQSSKEIKTTSNIEIKHIQPLQNKALIQYLSLRKIPFNLAKNYISEAYYKTGNKQYFALAFKNNSNGYELRNKYFKGSTHPKDITTIEIKNSHSINIFEGFMDYLTALQFFKTDKPNQTTIILNSTTNTNKTLSIIKQYKTVNLFLDNDSTGTKAVETYQTAHPNIKNRALEFYPTHKDFNEFLTFTK